MKSEAEERRVAGWSTVDECRQAGRHVGRERRREKIEVDNSIHIIHLGN